MQWLPCSARSHDATITTSRFGHTAVCISGTGSVWGTDLVVVFGGVSYSDGEATLEHHAALSDVAVLQAEADVWFAPQVSASAPSADGPSGGLPEARAFHCAAAVDRRMYVFGGHVLSYDPEHHKKRRRFFNDLWCLDTATNRVVLFGGERDAGVLDDLWTFKGADGSEPAKWTQIRLRPSPAGRFGHAMAGCGSRLAVFGGCLDASGLLSFSRTYVQCNELWVLDLATFSWHRVEAPEGVTPHAGPASPDDPALHAALAAAQQQYLADGQPLAAAAAPPPPGAPPPVLLLPCERMCHSMAAAGGRLLLVGGRKREGICPESWWLAMGPDNLTPALTVPPPAAVSAALRSGAAASLDQLRAAVGLHPAASPPPPPAAAEPADPLQALAALGRQLAAADGGGPGGPGGGPDAAAAAAVARARRHLACCAAEQLRLDQLPLVLSDCQGLLRARSAAAWAGLEAETRQQQPADGAAPPPPPDLAVLAAYVSSVSHPLVGRRPEELRLGDAPELLAVYRSLVLAAGTSGGGAGGGPGSGGGGALAAVAAAVVGGGRA
ncbi:hypothetical protein GPECTOR_12g463 [Gonium pectorale]|uniref:Uncharacterized protein n=1 Tax=Gonium pectorale TaxID=33097 RepID=A0A150GQ80_GONPE|nr:hypothetical protein GPECTOR_12g463 [Gonium pectorale]|eukprot:KXZ51500.1 hypothetical protein GPECTOR_12g463 [Gonium pectorale]